MCRTMDATAIPAGRAPSRMAAIRSHSTMMLWTNSVLDLRDFRGTTAAATEMCPLPREFQWQARARPFKSDDASGQPERNVSGSQPRTAEADVGSEWIGQCQLLA